MNYSDFDRLFDSLLMRQVPSNKITTYKSFNEKENYEINQTKDGSYLFFEAPGFNKENLKVELEDGVISIEGKRTYKLNGEEIERTISKKFNLESSSKYDNIEATIEDGILTIFVPNYKKQEKKKISLL